MIHRFPNVCSQRPLLHHPRLSLPSVPLYRERSLRRTMRADTTGLNRKAGNDGKCLANTSVLLISGSVPPIPMLPRCASRAEESTSATIPTTSWMEAKAGLS